MPADPSDNLAAPGFPEALGLAVAAVGRDRFFDAMLDLLGTACPMDAGGAMVFYRNQRPRQLVHRFDPAERRLPKDFYLSGPYALDPIYHLFLKGAGSGVYWLREFAPDDFFESEFYRMFYSRIGLSDDIFVMWRIDPDSALLFFLERSVRHPGFRPRDLQALRPLLPFALAASARHWELAGPGARPELEDFTHRQVQSTIDHFARSLLTRREREVLFCMLQGYSAAMTAERLATREGTIKIHRKNIHRKLAIGSQAELFSLFISCIPFADPEAATDPLPAYRNRSGPGRAAVRTGP
jgi:DNA-binding CsgD family transcriptional regulator